MEITFRRLNIADVNIFVHYRIMFLKELYNTGNHENESTLQIELKKYFEQAIKNKTLITWMAQLENEPIGFGSMVIQQKPGNFKHPNGKEGYIMNIYTLSKTRNSGVCAQILQNIMADAKELDISKLYLHASKEGEVIYRKIGFSEPELLDMEFCI